MRRGIGILVIGLVALVAVSSAGAHPNRKAHHFQKLAAVKSRQLRQARNSLRAERARAASLEAQVAGLQAQVASLTQERNQAQTRAAALDARLAAIPTPLQAAYQYMERIVWAAEATDPSRPKGEIVALAAMDYVADNHVNLFMRSYLLEHGGLPALTTADAILTAQAGLCGNAEIAFESLVRHFGFDVRRANFYYSDPAPQGHTAAEVYYGGSWHFFDPTFSLYWRGAAGDVLAITTVRANGGIEYKNNALLFNVIENKRDAGGGGISDTWFETDPTTVVQLLG